MGYEYLLSLTKREAKKKKESKRNRIKSEKGEEEKKANQRIYIQKKCERLFSTFMTVS